MAARPLTPESVKFLAVHCSATPATQDIGVAEIDRMHRKQGWRCIGYHYVIRRDGTVQTGRPANEPGAHVENWNHCSLGICLVGGVDSKLKPEANFTPQQFASLKALLAELKKTYRDATVQGHRDFPKVAKACPSFNVATWLKTGKVVA